LAIGWVAHGPVAQRFEAELAAACRAPDGHGDLVPPFPIRWSMIGNGLQRGRDTKRVSLRLAWRMGLSIGPRCGFCLDERGQFGQDCVYPLLAHPGEAVAREEPRWIREPFQRSAGWVPTMGGELLAVAEHFDFAEFASDRHLAWL